MLPAPRANVTAKSSSSCRSFCFTCPSSARQLCTNLIKTDAARYEQHQQMIDEISSLGSHSRAVVVLRGDDRLSRFLADLFQYLVETAVEKVRGVRTFRPLAVAALDQLVKLVQQQTEIFIGRRGIKTRSRARVTRRTGRFQYLVETAVEKVRGVRTFRPLAVAALDQLVKLVQQQTEIFIGRRGIKTRSRAR